MKTHRKVALCALVLPGLNDVSLQQLSGQHFKQLGASEGALKPQTYLRPTALVGRMNTKDVHLFSSFEF